MAKKEALSATDICKAAKNKRFLPIYVLMGEESYYIDKICSTVLEYALNEDERDFNLTIFYGLETDVKDVISACKRYPAMSEYQVVILKEAQMMDNADMLQYYVRQPLKSTILIICNKNGNLKAPEFMKLAKASDDVVIYESKKITDNNIGKLIVDYCAELGLTINGKAVSMLKDYVGTDLVRLFSEVDKLSLVIKGSKDVTPELIERNIGISKDYNNFELENALRERNVGKSMKIIDYFQKNPRKNPTVLTTGLLFSFFSNLMLVHTAKNRSEQGLMEQLDSKSPYRVKIFVEACRVYSAASCFAAIGYLREFDTKSKGIGSKQNEYDLLRELIFKILNS